MLVLFGSPRDLSRRISELICLRCFFSMCRNAFICSSVKIVLSWFSMDSWCFFISFVNAFLSRRNCPLYFSINSRCSSILFTMIGRISSFCFSESLRRLLMSEKTRSGDFSRGGGGKWPLLRHRFSFPWSLSNFCFCSLFIFFFLCLAIFTKC